MPHLITAKQADFVYNIYTVNIEYHAIWTVFQYIYLYYIDSHGLIIAINKTSTISIVIQVKFLIEICARIDHFGVYWEWHVNILASMRSSV